jgi:hypothetical protein
MPSPLGQAQLLLLLAVTLLPPVAHAQTREVIRREVKTNMGQEVRANHHAGYDSTCQPRPITFTLVKAPSNGTVEARRETITAGKAKVGAFSCEGRSISGLAIYYMPAEGFQGPESFSYEVRYEAGTLAYEAVVQVK